MNISDKVAYRTSRTLHWFCAITYVFLAVSMPIALDMVSGSQERRFAHDVHQSIATLFTVALVLRFSWIWLTKNSGLKTEFKYRWQFWMARINHFLLYTLMVVTPLSGFAFKLTSGKAIAVFGYDLVGPIMALKDPDWKYYTSEFHLFVLSVFYVLIFLHVMGALMHVVQHWVDKRKSA